MASTDAKPVPQKNVAFRVTFPILDADGDLVTGAAGLDSEVSKDGGTFADATSEATEIATSSGVYYLDLTQTEMNADTVAVIVKTSTVGAKTTTIVMYPEEAGDVRVNVTQFGGTNLTAAAGIPEVKVASLAANSITSSVIAADAIGASQIAADAIGSSELAAGAVTEIQSGLSVLTEADIRTAVGLASDNLDTQLAAISAFLDTEVAAILAAVDTEVAAIKTKTDSLTFTTANRVDSQVYGMESGTVTASALAADAANEAADALLDRTAGIETGMTLRQALRVVLAATAGKATGLAGNTVTYRDTNDTVDRITAAVDDVGNRTSVTLNTA